MAKTWKRRATRSPFVIHQGQYVLAGVDVQRLLVKSVRFAKVLAIEMPVERGFPAAVNGLENRAAALPSSSRGMSTRAFGIGIQQREGRAAGSRAAAQSARAGGSGRYSACDAAVVVLLGRRQHEPAWRGVMADGDSQSPSTRSAALASRCTRRL